MTIPPPKHICFLSLKPYGNNIPFTSLVSNSYVSQNIFFTFALIRRPFRRQIAKKNKCGENQINRLIPSLGFSSDVLDAVDGLLTDAAGFTCASGFLLDAP